MKLSLICFVLACLVSCSTRFNPPVCYSARDNNGVYYLKFTKDSFYLRSPRHLYDMTAEGTYVYHRGLVKMNGSISPKDTVLKIIEHTGVGSGFTITFHSSIGYKDDVIYLVTYAADTFITTFLSSGQTIEFDKKIDSIVVQKKHLRYKVNDKSTYHIEIWYTNYVLWSYFNNSEWLVSAKGLRTVRNNPISNIGYFRRQKQCID